MRWAAVRPSGEIDSVGTAPDGASFDHFDPDLLILLDAPEAVGFHSHYWDGADFVTIPPQPSPHHHWDWPTKTWLPDLDRAREARQTEVGTEFIRRDHAPIAYAEALFDADTQARENISGTLNRLLRGDGLPAGWIGWRDHANAMHWPDDDAATVQAHLAGLSRAIEDRKQALLAAAWQHKAAIGVLSDIDGVLGYDLTVGWPR